VSKSRELLKIQVAQKAAELISEEGISDYLFAKKKAARILSYSDKDPLPSNEQIDYELKIYQSIFLDNHQKKNIKMLRVNALKMMKKLSFFNIYLTGNVLEGTAAKYPIIELNLYSNNSKEIEYFLMNNLIAFDIKEGQLKGQKRITYILYEDNNTFHIHLKDEDEIKKIKNKIDIKKLQALLLA
jgi:hypothetical protein